MTEESQQNRNYIQLSKSLHELIENNDKEGVQHLIENHTQDQFRELNLLHLAIDENKLEIAEYLIERGWDINKCDTIDQTPLLIAIENNNINAIKLLYKNGASILNVDEHQNGALQICKDANSSKETTKVVLECLCDYNIKKNLEEFLTEMGGADKNIDELDLKKLDNLANIVKKHAKRYDAMDFELFIDSTYHDEFTSQMRRFDIVNIKLYKLIKKELKDLYAPSGIDEKGIEFLKRAKENIEGSATNLEYYTKSFLERFEGNNTQKQRENIKYAIEDMVELKLIKDKIQHASAHIEKSYLIKFGDRLLDKSMLPVPAEPYQVLAAHTILPHTTPQTEKDHLLEYIKEVCNTDELIKKTLYVTSVGFLENSNKTCVIISKKRHFNTYFRDNLTLGYYDQKHTIITRYKEDTKEFTGTLVHETKHYAEKAVYKSENAAPYKDTDTHAKKTFKAAVRDTLFILHKELANPKDAKKEYKIKRSNYEYGKSIFKRYKENTSYPNLENSKQTIIKAVALVYNCYPEEHEDTEMAVLTRQLVAEGYKRDVDILLAPLVKFERDIEEKNFERFIFDHPKKDKLGLPKSPEFYEIQRLAEKSIDSKEDEKKFSKSLKKAINKDKNNENFFEGEVSPRRNEVNKCFKEITHKPKSSKNTKELYENLRKSLIKRSNSTVTHTIAPIQRNRSHSTTYLGKK